MVSESKQKRVAYRQQVVRRLPLALLCAAALSFTLFLFTPMDIYSGNRTEFLFSFTDMGGWLLALALVGTMLFGALIALTPRRVSAVIAAVVFWLGVMGYAQGMFLNIGLKSLLGDGGAGDTPLWLYILDTALWVAAGVAAVLGALNMERRSWIRTAAGIALVVVLGMQVVGSVSIFGKVFARDNAAAGTSAAAGVIFLEVLNHVHDKAAFQPPPGGQLSGDHQEQAQALAQALQPEPGTGRAGRRSRPFDLADVGRSSAGRASGRGRAGGGCGCLPD